jgi:hypothetical protein
MALKTIETHPQDFIAVVKIHYHDSPTQVWSQEQWKEVGGWKGFLRQTSQNIKEVKRLERTTMLKDEFVNLKEWEP